MQVGFFNFLARQKAFNKAARGGRNRFLKGGVMESGEDRGRGNGSLVKDKALLLEGQVPRG